MKRLALDKTWIGCEKLKVSCDFPLHKVLIHTAVSVIPMVSKLLSAGPAKLFCR